jgi:dynein intermediate chain 1
VGTEEGLVHLATTAYSSRYLRTFPAHSTPVYNIQWNPFVPEVFVTCAAEFVLKMWHKDSVRPILRFDLGALAGDVAWAPYSSTVFAAVTSEGKVFVYDLSINKYNPVCVQVHLILLDISSN